MHTSLEHKGAYSLHIETSYANGRAYVVNLHDPKNDFIDQIHLANTESKDAFEWFANHQDAEICGWMQMLLDLYSRLGHTNKNAACAIWDLIMADELNERELAGLKREYSSDAGIIAFEVALKKLESFSGAKERTRDLLLGLAYNTIGDAKELFRHIGLIKKDVACTLKIDDRTVATKQIDDPATAKQPENAAYNVVFRPSANNTIVAELFGPDIRPNTKLAITTMQSAASVRWFVEHKTNTITHLFRQLLSTYLSECMHCTTSGLQVMEAFNSQNICGFREKIEALHREQPQDKTIGAVYERYREVDSIPGAIVHAHKIISEADLSNVTNMDVFFAALAKAQISGAGIAVEDRIGIKMQPTTLAHYPDDPMIQLPGTGFKLN